MGAAMIDQAFDESQTIRGHGARAWRFSVDEGTAPKSNSTDLRVLLLKNNVAVNPNEVSDIYFRIRENQAVAEIAGKINQMFEDDSARQRFYGLAGSSLVTVAASVDHLDALKHFASEGCSMTPGLSFEVIGLDQREIETFKGREYPVHKLAEYGNTAGLEWLVASFGIEQLHVPHRGFTALHCSAQAGNVETALSILEMDPSTYFDRGPQGKSFQQTCAEMGKEHVWRAAAAWRGSIAAREALDEIAAVTGPRP